MKTIKLLILSAICVMISSCNGHSSKYIYDGLIPVQKISETGFGGFYGSNRYVYIDQNGNEILASEVFTKPNYFSDGLAVVYRGYNNGFYINIEGDTVIRFADYGAYRGSGFWENRAILESNQDYIIIDNTGKIIFKVDKSDYSRPITMCYNDLILFEDGNDNGRIYDADGKILHEEKEYGFVPFSQSLPYKGIICAYKTEGRKFIYGAINVKGEVVIPFEYKRAIRFDRNGYAVVTDKEDRVGLIDTKGKYKIEPGKYNNLEVAGNNLYRYNKGKESGLCDEKGEPTTTNEILVARTRGQYDKDANGYNILLPLNGEKYLAFKRRGLSADQGILALIDNSGKNLLEEKEYYFTERSIDYKFLIEHYKYGTPYTIYWGDAGPAESRVIIY